MSKQHTHPYYSPILRRSITKQKLKLSFINYGTFKGTFVHYCPNNPHLKITINLTVLHYCTKIISVPSVHFKPRKGGVSIDQLNFTEGCLYRYCTNPDIKLLLHTSPVFNISSPLYSIPLIHSTSLCNGKHTRLFNSYRRCNITLTLFTPCAPRVHRPSFSSPPTVTYNLLYDHAHSSQVIAFQIPIRAPSSLQNQPQNHQPHYGNQTSQIQCSFTIVYFTDHFSCLLIL